MSNKPSINPKILVVLGSTATGKSDLAVDLALAFNGEVISADSRQVYIGMDLGTGKITGKEMRGVPHHMLDVANPKRVYTVSKFQKSAHEIIADIQSRGKLPIICGGTGFYIQSIVDNITLPDAPIDTKLRASLKGKTVLQLFSMLKKLDPARAKTIDKHNPVRLIRAIEIAKALGKVPKLKKNSLYDAIQIGLDLPDDVFEKKIRDRIVSRIKKGMIAEAKKLHSSGVSFKRFRMLGLEYRFLADLLEEKIDMKEFVEQLEIAIFQYVKKQRAWFRKDERITWFDPSKKAASKQIRTLVKTRLS